MMINKPGLMATIKSWQGLTNQIACEAISNLIFKCRRKIYPHRTLLVYKKPYSFIIGVTIIKKVN